ncbi:MULTISPECIES: zinc-binding dehydrogenase [Plantibacter]|uniref:zinc-binding dehydrogenase n=2 Tax=Microbacteriaceae TaxID=85023 RepID=UPI00177D0B17|nr:MULTISPECIES: zinc-binding dehydrogenase [Plantibacter]MBD8101836.1 zinc-binding dehydrogenase [Plantibacter sp. CFBP 8775]MDD9151947.1 zinc-binding dehydrogenase [Plantibacter flavus]
MHTTLTAHEGNDVFIRPSPIAMVWQGPGHPHQAMAVPGVTLGPGDVLVEVELATVCGSDVHTVLGHRDAATPLVLGHEQVGRVVAVGGPVTAVDGTVLVAGMRVVWSVVVSCGVCDRCSAGLEQKCRRLAKYGHDRVHRGWELSGGFATHVELLEGTAIVIVGETPPAAVFAPASCATATAIAALDAAGHDLPGTAVLVTGAGMLGLTVAAIATDAGARVVVSDPDPARRLLAGRFGAIATVDPTVGAAEHLDAAHLAAGVEGFPVAIEMSGDARAVDAAIASLSIGGTAVLVGSVSPGAPLGIDAERIVRRLLTVRGAHNYRPRDLARAVDFLTGAWRRYPFAELVGPEFPLQDVDEALVAAASGAFPRVGVRP